MLRFQRPGIHPDFLAGSEGAITEARNRVRAAMDEHQKPIFEPLWRKQKYKRLFMATQHGKCGYCECKIRPGQTGDVEHYAPKSEVGEFLEHGYELLALSNVIGRRIRTLSPRGYWWLAYDWANYLVACSRCNNAWKRILFPVEESGGPRTLPPEPHVEETPLLIHPLGPDDPVEHFRFNMMGQIEALTQRGAATIEVCGLNRGSLCDARQEKAELAWEAIYEIADEADILPALRTLARYGREDYAHAGMVRAIVREALGLEWTDVLAAFKAYSGE